jgi:Lar family restriction alleviation protein
MSAQVELKGCPFCGGKPFMYKWVTQSLWSSNEVTFSQVECRECDISGQSFCDDPDGEEAAEFWNTRY